MAQYNRGPSKKAIFLDRDGTLIYDKNYLNDVGRIDYLPYVFQALKELRDQGFLLFVISNQSGITRRLVQMDNLLAIHAKIKGDLSTQGIDIQEFYFTPHINDENFYRKPNPGMILQAAFDYNLNLGKSWMIGDRMLDVETGHRAGTYSVLLGKKEDPADFNLSPPDLVVETLQSISQKIEKFFTCPRSI